MISRGRPGTARSWPRPSTNRRSGFRRGAEGCLARTRRMKRRGTGRRLRSARGNEGVLDLHAGLPWVGRAALAAGMLHRLPSGFSGDDYSTRRDRTRANGSRDVQKKTGRDAARFLFLRLRATDAYLTPAALRSSSARSVFSHENAVAVSDFFTSLPPSRSSHL